MKKKYRREMDYVYAVMGEMQRKLERQIKDLDDVRVIMDILGKIRQQEVDMELRIDPIEEAFNILSRHEILIEKEVMEQVDSLRYSWRTIQNRAQDVHAGLLSMQPGLQQELSDNLENFRIEKETYCHEYRFAGPMQAGLSPRDASDRLILFQVSIIFYIKLYNNNEKLNVFIS